MVKVFFCGGGEVEIFSDSFTFYMYISRKTEIRLVLYKKYFYMALPSLLNLLILELLLCKNSRLGYPILFFIGILYTSTKHEGKFKICESLFSVVIQYFVKKYLSARVCTQWQNKSFEI